MSGFPARTIRERLALIRGVDLEQLDGLDQDESQEDQFAFEPNLARLIIGLEQLDLGENDEEPLVGFGVLPEEFVGQVGLNETPLTKALISGQFTEAERLIVGNTDVDFLNDGVHNCTPLNLALTGRQAFSKKTRNLKIARLLIEHGANPNLGMPHHDLEISLSIPESPFETLLQYYLDLLRTFRNDGSKVLTMNDDNPDLLDLLDLLETIGINGEENLTSEILIDQTKELINLFLDRGADVNLQSHQSGRTLFHVVLSAEVTDYDLIERMVTLGAIVNLTDIHGTTPYMDVLRPKNVDSAVALFRKISNLGKRILLDAQNCCGESSLWRSMYNGLLPVSLLLLQDGAFSATAARVQLSKPKRPSIRFRFFHRRTSISKLPAILAPCLGDSPAYREFAGGNKFSIHHCDKVISSQVSPLIDDGWFCTPDVEKAIYDMIPSCTSFGHLTHEKVFQETAMVQLLFGKASAGLRQRCLRSILYSILFQKDSDSVMKWLLELQKNDEAKPKFSAKQRKGSRSSQHDDGSDAELFGDSACVVSSVLSETDRTQPEDSPSGLAFSEPEMRVNTSTPRPLRVRRRRRRRSRVTTFNSDSPLQLDENWSLRHDPEFSDPQRRRNLPQSLEGLEIEISREEEPISATGTSVVRIRRLLQETNDMLERLQNDFDASLLHENSSERLSSPDQSSLPDPDTSDSEQRPIEECCDDAENDPKDLRDSKGSDQPCGDVDRSAKEAMTSEKDACSSDLSILAESLSVLRRADDAITSVQIALATCTDVALPETCGLERDEKLQSDDENEIVQNLSQIPSVIDDSISEVGDSDRLFAVSSGPEDSSSDDEVKNDAHQYDSWDSSSSLDTSSSKEGLSHYQPSPTDESWGGGPFSLRQTTLLAQARFSRHYPGHGSSTPATEESVIEKLDTYFCSLIAKKIGIPPGLISCFELEVARLQLLMAVHGHTAIECDRGCEGDDSNSSDDETSSTETETDESSWEFGSLSGPFSTGVDLSSSFDSSDRESDFQASVPQRPRTLSSTSSNSTLDELNRLDFRLGGLDSGDEDWFSVVGKSEHETNTRFVRENVDSETFDHSTDSDTSQDSETFV